MDVLYFSFSKSNRTFEWLKRVDLVKTHIISYVHTYDHNSNMQSLCRIMRCVVFIYAQWRTLSGLFFPSLCLLLCHVYHITVGEGHRWGEVEAEVYAVGRSALLKQGCYCCDLFRKPSWKTHISAKWWVVEPVSFWLIAWQYIVFWVHSRL